MRLLPFLALPIAFVLALGPAQAADSTDSSSGTGTAITRSLKPGDALDAPHVGPGVQRDVPLAEALERLRESQDAVRALHQEVAAAPSGADRTATPLGERAQKVLGDAQHAVQALQYSGAVPADSPQVRDALTTISEAQAALLQEAESGAPALETLGNQLAALTMTAEQAASTAR